MNTDERRFITNGKPTVKFPKGNKRAKCGLRNPPGGRPTNKEIEKKRAEVEGLAAIAAGILEGLKGQGRKYGEQIDKQAFKDNKVLVQLVKMILDKTIENAKQQIEHTGHAGITLRNYD